jgi:hypothetical protein
MADCATCDGNVFDTLQHFRAEGGYCRLLTGYLFNLHRGRDHIEEMIRSDMQGMCDLGAHKYAFDLQIALECFQAEFPRLNVQQVV